jgi:CheY-like chemotaxis protein
MGAKIAVIDDSAIAIFWIKQKLEDHGYEVVTYQSPLGIVNFVKKHQPALLLLDVKMPAMDGRTVCRLLKGNDGTRNVTILFHSSLSAKELEEMVKTCGADGFVEKTEDVDKIISQIQRYLKTAK